MTVPKVRSSGCLDIGRVFPFRVGSFSFLLVKSISCNLSISKRELCSLDHSNVLLGRVIMLCIFACVAAKFFPPARNVTSSMKAGASSACFSFVISMIPAF